MYRFRKGFYADIRVEDRFTSAVIYKNGVLDECNQNTVKKAFIRVFDGSMWYYSSTSDVSDIQKELDKLYGYATENAEIDSNPIVQKFEVNRDTVYIFSDKNVRHVPIEQKKEFIFGLSQKIKSKYLALNYSVYLDRNSQFEFYSSKGAQIKYDFQTAGIACSESFKNGGDKFDNKFSKSATAFEDIKIEDGELEGFIKESENFLLNAKSAETGSFPVVFSPVVTGVFAHESFGHKSEADFMLGDESLAKEWAIGKKVASELLTITESGKKPGSGYAPYDDEGTKAGETYLIKNGVLSGRLHSAVTAAYLNEEITGNARAVSCDFEPIVRMTNTLISGGKSSFEELISPIKFGYYIKDFKHGSGMSTFTIAPGIAYEIVDGKIGNPVKIAVVTGDVFTTLGLIDGVGNDETLLSFVTGGCGKMEQYPLPVGFGGPHIRISQMKVG